MKKHTTKLTPKSIEGSGLPTDYKKAIAEYIWKDESVSKKRIIDVHVYNIRQLFGKRVIQSQKGNGYRINKKLIG